MIIAPFIHSVGSGNPDVKLPIEIDGSRTYHEAVFHLLLGWMEAGAELAGGGFLGGQKDKLGNIEAVYCRDELKDYCQQRINAIKVQHGDPCVKYTKHYVAVNNWLKKAHLYTNCTSMEGVVGTFDEAVNDLPDQVKAVLVTDEARRSTAIIELISFSDWGVEEAYQAVIGKPRPDGIHSAPEVQQAKQRLAIKHADEGGSLNDFTERWEASSERRFALNAAGGIQPRPLELSES